MKGGEQTIGEILRLLNGADSGAAWAAFTERYSGLILRAVRQFEYDQDGAEDCFLYVCEKLCENDFRRLLKFNTAGTARFRTWLGSVVYRLCVDWHRKEYGRATTLPAISALPAFDQNVFQLYFEEGLDRESCRRLLQTDFPGCTSVQLGEAIARVHQLMTPRQRWRVGLQRRKHRPHARDRRVSQLRDRAASPEQLAGQEEQRLLVRAALEKLSDRQRLLLLLRYEQGLTLGKIAELMDLKDPFRARRAIQAAIDKVQGLLRPEDFGKWRD